VAERERALAYGAEFRLGSLERVSRSRQMHRYTGLGVVFGGFVLVAGLPTLIGIDAGVARWADVKDFTVDYYEAD
jgi:hypothetical protein